MHHEGTPSSPSSPSSASAVSVPSPQSGRRRRSHGLATLYDNIRRLRGLTKFTAREVGRLKALRLLYLHAMHISAERADETFANTPLAINDDGHPVADTFRLADFFPHDEDIASPLANHYNSTLLMFTDYVRAREQDRRITHTDDIEYLFSLFIAKDFASILAQGCSEAQLVKLEAWRRLIDSISLTAESTDKAEHIFTRTEASDSELSMYTTLMRFSLSVESMIDVVKNELKRQTVSDAL